MGFDPARHHRDARSGRFAPAPSGRVTVRQPDGSARTYRIEQDPATGRLVQAVRDRFAAAGDGPPDGETETPGSP